ncbi:MAG: helix-turn-helix domain-containing protein [Thermoanaerobaculia bacterium]|nr:helix-turn-helix domain-containing protein [Thermoanaerobaculia bacterium]
MRGEGLNRQLTSLVSELVDRGLTLEQARNEFEKQFILASLRRSDGNFSRSAEYLGVHRNTLRNKLGSLGITPDEYADLKRSRRLSRR